MPLSVGRLWHPWDFPIRGPTPDAYKTADHLPIETDCEPARRPDGRFGPGNYANPVARPKGSVGGRQHALKILDSTLAEAGTQERLAAALKEHLEEDPVRFFKTIVMPLLPTEARHEISAEVARVEWVRLSDTPRHGAKADDISE